MWIYLLRHGIAEHPSPGSADEERRLTSEGVDRLTRAAKTWQKLITAPELVLTSPYLRARETAAVFAEAVGYAGKLRDEAKLVPHGRTADTLEVLEGELLAQTASVALVGHEPHLGYLLGSLLTGHSHMSMPLKRGMLVGLETESTTNVIAGLRFSMTQRFAAKLS
ncbi:MAG: phosphohistidine phosphatase [Neolewinella sp.]|jgi:phosphohistidine phosphatase